MLHQLADWLWRDVVDFKIREGEFGAPVLPKVRNSAEPPVVCMLFGTLAFMAVPCLQCPGGDVAGLIEEVDANSKVCATERSLLKGNTASP